mgnify:FL=1|jgi:tyrosine-protein phosphatase YwqE
MFFFKKKENKISDFFTNSFVDIHSHLLPGLDDGASDLDESIELIKKMSDLGIKNFITTPHVLGDIYQNSSTAIKEKLQKVKDELLKRNITDVSIDVAAEYMLDEQFSLLLEKNDILTLKDNYILVEMSYFNPPLNIFNILFEIQLKGYKPILAHPERYNFYHNDFEKFYKLKNAGCLFQLNLLSVSEYYGKNIQKISKKLLNLGMYDFVGTDLHNTKHLNHLESLLTDTNKEQLKLLLKNNSVVFKK